MKEILDSITTTKKALAVDLVSDIIISSVTETL